MATEQPSMPVNGHYAPHQAQGYGVAEQNYAAHNANNSTSAAAGYGASGPSSGNNNSSNGASDIPKEEVGWYFVEQYYTTLSRSPEKLFLFYNKRSQFVSGVEEEKVEVCVGQKAINDRIKELDFQDCKVRITNVDSQASDQNIVIQVIGEISNKSLPHRKFAQTFVLAGQTNGYFVLNDIFRYIAEEEEEIVNDEVQDPSTLPGGYQEPAPTAGEPGSKGLTSSNDPTAQEHDAAEVDHKMEEAIQKDEAAAPEESSDPAAEVNGTPVPEPQAAQDDAHKEDEPAAAVSAAEQDDAAEQVAKEAEADAVEAAAEEKPNSPEASPAEAAQPAPERKASPALPAVPAAPPKPAAPKTWANLAAAAARVATPAIPAPAAPSQAPAQPKAAPPPQQSQPISAPAPQAASTPPAREPTPDQDAGAGWQSVGPDHKAKPSRGQPQAPVAEAPNSRAYIKNVYESIDADALKAALSKHGEIVYFDVSRQKNCAFVDFATPAGFQAAVAANPHQIGSDQVFVEERRLRPGSYPYHPRGGMGRGRGDGRPAGQGRGGFNKEGGRGGFVPRGRGGNMGGRGRGGAPPASQT